jgi:hypothetical protein
MPFRLAWGLRITDHEIDPVCLIGASIRPDFTMLSLPCESAPDCIANGDFLPPSSHYNHLIYLVILINSDVMCAFKNMPAQKDREASCG